MKLLLAILLLFSSALQAQTIFSGRVVDAISGQPLESASVMMMDNRAASTLTDQYGHFYLKTAGKPGQLLISYIGYKPDTTVVQGRQSLIALSPALVNLKDVVVLQQKSIAQFATLAKIDLSLKPVRNTQELMRLVPGLFIAQHAGGGKAEQIFLRGFDCDHGTDVAVSVDGLPVNLVSHAHGQGYADAHFIIPETVNSIDFGAGPYYTEKGNLNTAGYVAFSTYHNIPQSRVQLEAGRFNTLRTLVMLDLIHRHKDKQNAYIAGDINYTNGPSINPQHFSRVNLFGKYNRRFSPNTEISASLSAFRSQWDASGQVPTRAVKSGLIDRFGSIDPSEGGNTERYNANIILNHRLSDQTRWESQVFYSRYAFNLYSDFTFFLHDPVNGDEINQRESRNLYGFNSKISHRGSRGGLEWQSDYGLGLRYDATSNTTLAEVVKRQFLSFIKLGDVRESNSYAYYHEQLAFGHWVVEAGIRADYLHFDFVDKLQQQQPGQGKAILSPKLNVQYNLNTQWQLYVKAGKGFHSNDARVVVAREGYDILPAAYGADFGIIVKPTENLFLNAAIWYLFLEQEFVYNGDDADVEPSGKTQREGIDLIARYQFSAHLFANINLNLTRPRAFGVAKTLSYIPLAPTATSTGGLFYKSLQGFNGGLSYRYIKNRPANEDNSLVAKGYFLLDASLNYTKRRYEVGIACENILNSRWEEAQFATESRLKNEAAPVTEINFTPGTPFFARLKLAVFF